MIVGMTGGRPKRLPWGTNENDPRCDRLKAELKKTVLKFIDKGADEFICGMALGSDTYFAEIILELKQTRNIKLIAALSCMEQSSRWKANEKERFNRIISQCDGVESASIAYTEGCESMRNHIIVDKSDVLVAVYSGARRSGTAQTISYAEQKDIPIEIIDPYEL